jgi:hypothetical protein
LPFQEYISVKYINKIDELENRYTDQLLYLIEKKVGKGPRSYGFEYEFISSNPLDLEIMERLYSFMPECGFMPDQGYFSHSLGMHVTFEPGGQIEYHCLPFYALEDNKIRICLELIERTNSKIYEELDINYIATGYIEGRTTAPLCLKKKRYRNLHSRMPKCGSRGLEMMKGTASIHLHAGICNVLELASLFSRVRRISERREFRMGPDRRDIWDNTDPSRCGMPYHDIDENSSPRQVVGELVRFALSAEDIGLNIPFYMTDDLSFDTFMYHMTTIFTDIRLNMKGPSIELRTLDSMPFPQFEERLKEFISMLESGLGGLRS